MSQLRVAVVQSDIVWEQPLANFERLQPWLTSAAGAGAQLVVLPEMFACGFTMRSERVAEPPGGPSTAFLVEQAARHGFWLCGSLPELSAGDQRPHNTLVLAGPAGELFRYHKLHPFTFAGEHEHYAAGREWLRVELLGVRCCFFICYDLRFANEFWAQARSTDAYVVVANWPERRRAHWTALLRARAIENQAYVIGANRVGRGDELDYSGDSCIVDPWGETLTTAAGQATLLLADLDARAVTEARTRFPVMDDRRAL